MTNSRPLIWLMVVASTFFWGSNFNAGHAIADEVTALTAAAERFAIALLGFLLIRLFQGKAESQLQPRDMLVLLALGVIGVFGFNYAFFTALHSTSALNAALIMALSPMVSLLFSAWLLPVKIRGFQYLGIIIAFVGVSLVITGGNFGLLHIAIGDAWMMFACLVWSLYSVGSKKFAGHVPPLQFARWTVSIGAVFAYIFWLRGVYALGPERATIAFNLVPVFTLLVNLALGTVPLPLQIVGMVLVLGGVLISSGWRPRYSRKVAS